MFEEKRLSIIFIILLLVTLILNSCDALRDNPLDPNSTDHLLGSISGSVQTFSLPYTPISGVEVYWKPGNIMVLTDTSGSFKISNVRTDDGMLIFRKAGFHTDTISVQWRGSKKISEQVNLNSYPTLDSMAIYSEVINVSDTSSQMYQLVFDIKVTDLDNDIDTMFVINDQLGLRKPMDFDIANKTYESILTPEELNLTDVEQVVGLKFNFLLKNIMGGVYQLDGGTITRVIKNRIIGLLPDGNKIISSFPFTLQWSSFNPGYNFHYEVQVFTNDVSNPLLVLSQNNISSQDTTYNVDSLATGNYWWVIWVIDDFNNMSRSAPATFIIQ